MPEARIVAHSASAFDHEQHRYLEAGFDDFFAKPFRYERICECVSKLLDVTLESEPAGEEAMERPPGAVKLPERLAARIRAAAEIHNVTELRACIDEAAQLEDGAPWAACLGRWVARYEMEKIITALSPAEEAEAIHAS
jgi:CheY-like chemotaxis protein